MRVVQAIENLKLKIDELETAIMDDSTSIAVVHESEFSPRRAVVEAYKTLTYEDGADARSLFQLPALVTLDRKYVSCVSAVNSAKRNVSSHVDSFKKASGKSHFIANSLLRTHLAECGMKKIQYKCIYREIVCLSEVPIKLRWYWEHGGWGKQKTMLPSEGVELLKKQYSLNEPHIKLQVQALNALPQNELVAQRHKMNPVLKVNAMYEDRAISYVGTLPIALCYERSEYQAPRIEFALSRKEIQSIKSPRNSKFEDTPLCPSINLFRYKETHRKFK